MSFSIIAVRSPLKLDELLALVSGCKCFPAFDISWTYRSDFRLVPNHPCSQEWLDEALEELNLILEADPEAGYAEIVADDDAAEDR